MMFQHYALFPHLTVLENVAFTLKMRGMRKAERRRRAQDMLTQVQMDRFAERLPAQLSGGQQQRVAIARSLVNSPDILMGDEPTGNLDSRTSREVIELFRELNEDGGITVILVTHDQEIARHAKRTVVLRDGRIVADTTDFAQAAESLRSSEEIEPPV
jgi:ABC-type lipoprotein export system ATPase subunit